MKEQAIKWWNNLSPQLKCAYCNKHNCAMSRHWSTLTNQEITDIYQSEITTTRYYEAN